RKTTERGAKLCKLNDSCLVFTVNLLAVMTALAFALLLGTSLVKLFLVALNSKTELEARAVGSPSSPFHWIRSTGNYLRSRSSRVFSTSDIAKARTSQLTTFEKNCVGGSVQGLIIDCEDFCYTMRQARRYSTVESVLLAGFVYDGGFLYRSDDALFLALTSVLPRFLLRTFNVLIPRWEISASGSSVAEASMVLWCNVRRRKMVPVPLF
ncbi:hypothetical protein Gpo141_00014611, partial [Globisporangium polare]